MTGASRSTIRPQSERCAQLLWAVRILFMGSDNGGERAACMYTLIGTAKLCGLNPQAYLQYVLERIADHPINRIDEFLPWNVAAKLPQASPAT
jgi:transposase